MVRRLLRAPNKTRHVKPVAAFRRLVGTVSLGALTLVLLGLLLLTGRAEAAGPVQVRLFGYDESQGLVVLYANGPLTPRAFHLSGPERWVIDLPNTRYNDLTNTLGGIKGTPIRRIRAAQFKGGMLRIVFDLDRYAEFPQEVTNPGPGNYRLAFRVGSGGTKQAHPTPAPTILRPTPTPAVVRPAPKPTFPPLVLRPTPRATRAPVSAPRPQPHEEPTGPAGLSLHRMGGGWQLTITTQTAFSYVVSQRNRPDRLQFDIQGAGSELPKDSLYVDNGLIARVRVVPLNQKTHRVIVEFDQPIKYSLRQQTNQRTLVLSLGGAPEPPPPQNQQAAEPPRRAPNERRVTIDAGHGGIDPGTIGAVGTLEKDVTLQMALRLRKLMQDSGMEVEMTRTKDMQILLRPRVEVGDAFDSDVFISIHANHIGDPSVAGIETYYFTPRSLPLARSVHRKLVAQLKRPDRGIRRNNFVVVKYNKMPAVLVEVGYLSNPTEERLLNNAQYQQRAAEAILAGVQEYFRTRSLRQ